MNTVVWPFLVSSLLLLKKSRWLLKSPGFTDPNSPGLTLSWNLKLSSAAVSASLCAVLNWKRISKNRTHILEWLSISDSLRGCLLKYGCWVNTIFDHHTNADRKGLVLWNWAAHGLHISGTENNCGANLWLLLKAARTAQGVRPLPPTPHRWDSRPCLAMSHYCWVAVFHFPKDLRFVPMNW